MTLILDANEKRKILFRRASRLGETGVRLSILNVGTFNQRFHRFPWMATRYRETPRGWRADSLSRSFLLLLVLLFLILLLSFVATWPSSHCLVSPSFLSLCSCIPLSNAALIYRLQLCRQPTANHVCEAFSVTEGPGPGLFLFWARSLRAAACVQVFSSPCVYVVQAVRVRHALL